MVSEEGKRALRLHASSDRMVILICSRSCCPSACLRSLPVLSRGAAGPAGLIYLANANLSMASMKDYPYLGVKSTCNENPTRPGASGPLKAFGNILLIGMRCQANPAMNITCPEPNRLIDALAKYGPLMISVDASSWQMYDSGIFNDNLCSGRIDHAVQLVGLGSEIDKNGVEQPYWLVSTAIVQPEWRRALRLCVGGEADCSCLVRSRLKDS
jgi:hypothetical protein